MISFTALPYLETSCLNVYCTAILQNGYLYKFKSLVEKLTMWTDNYYLPFYCNSQEKQILKGILTAQKMKISIKNFSRNLTKSAVSCGFCHICWRNLLLKTSFFVRSLIRKNHYTMIRGKFWILLNINDDAKICYLFWRRALSFLQKQPPTVCCEKRCS